VLDRDTLGTRSIHDPIDIQLVDRTVRLLNGGFPVNFDGRVNSVAPSSIQVTRPLMLGAAMQALATSQRRDRTRPRAVRVGGNHVRAVVIVAIVCERLWCPGRARSLPSSTSTSD
jgi:hypothetical protein